MIEVMMPDSKDNNVLYHQLYGTAKDKGDQPFSVNNAAKRSSVFTDLTFKDINITMQITVKMTVEGKPEFGSPIEKATHY